MWVISLALHITAHYLQLLASLSVHPFSLKIFPAAQLARVTAEPRLRDTSSRAWNNPQFEVMLPTMQISYVSKRFEFLENSAFWSSKYRCCYFLYKVNETRLLLLVQGQLPIFRSVMISSSSSRIRTGMRICHTFYRHPGGYCSTEVNINLICFCDCSETTALLH